MRFFRLCRRSRHAPEPSRSPEEPAPEPLKGQLPRHYDHVVRIGVETEPPDEAAFLATVSGRPWQTQSLGEGRYNVRVAVSGAALGSTRAALSEFHHTLTRAGVGVRVMFAARPHPRPSPSRRYLVLPRGWMTERRWLAAPIRNLMAWRSRGIIQAVSLTEAGSKLADFADRNPEAGPPDELVVVGPSDLPGATSPGTDSTVGDPLDDWRFLLAVAFLIVVVGGAALFGLYAITRRAEGGLFLTAVAFPIVLPFLFGAWQMFRRIPEGRINTWLPLGLTALAPPLAIALSTSNQDAYLDAFGIAPGDVVTVGPGRLFALAGFLPVLIALLVCLGAFGLFQYFHLGIRETPFRYRVPVAAVVLLYGIFTVSILLTTMQGPLERGARVGADHVAHYRSEGGEPRGHVGITPSTVCVEPGGGPVSRIGPPLTTDRPVLYFSGADNVDFLWDREHGLTKVTRFSVSLTPVPDLDTECPEPETAG